MDELKEKIDGIVGDCLIAIGCDSGCIRAERKAIEAKEAAVDRILTLIKEADYHKANYKLTDAVVIKYKKTIAQILDASIPPKVDKLLVDMKEEVYKIIVAEVVLELKRVGWKSPEEVAAFGLSVNEVALAIPKGEPPVLSDEEQFQCSLVSKYPYKDVEDVIREACIHQRDSDMKWSKEH